MRRRRSLYGGAQGSEAPHSCRAAARTACADCKMSPRSSRSVPPLASHVCMHPPFALHASSRRDDHLQGVVWTGYGIYRMADEFRRHRPQQTTRWKLSFRVFGPRLRAELVEVCVRWSEGPQLRVCGSARCAVAAHRTSDGRAQAGYGRCIRLPAPAGGGSASASPSAKAEAARACRTVCTFTLPPCRHPASTRALALRGVTALFCL